MKWTLGIETSCDDTSVALVNDQGQVHCSLMSSQIQGHTPFGGVVPELASRLHAEALLPLVDQAVGSLPMGWSEVDRIAVTSRPGLIGSLLVGVVTAKTLSHAKKIPLIDVNHIHGHIFSVFLHDAQYSPDPNFAFPYLCLVVSGGHTHLYRVNGFDEIHLLGRTRDDASGEAFDKFANLLRLGFPGGPLVDQMAKAGDRKAFSFPRSMAGDQIEWSFSGLKSAAARQIQSLPAPLSEKTKQDLCASYQEAICDVLLQKLEVAQHTTGVRNIAITGGVSANSRLRERSEDWCRSQKLNLRVPPIRFCTDNAAMIAFTGVMQARVRPETALDLTPQSQSLGKDFL